MKKIFNTTKGVLFILLSMSLLFLLSTSTILTTEAYFFRGITITTILYVVATAVPYLIMSTFLYGGLALLINRINPFGRYCKLFLLPAALFFFGYTCYGIIDAQDKYLHKGFALTLLFITVVAHFYLTIKVYNLLSYDSHNIRFEPKQ